jgi:hypothetical protein
MIQYVFPKRTNVLEISLLAVIVKNLFYEYFNRALNLTGHLLFVVDEGGPRLIQQL